MFLIRILLFLLPIVLVIMWLRWRSKRNSDKGLSEADELKAKIILAVLIVAILLTGLSFKLFDNSGSPTGRYVPAHIEDGKLIDGYFEEESPAEEPQAKEAQETAPKQADDEENPS